MSHFFTDYGDMVGKRPRQAYFQELQDAVAVLQAQYANLAEGPIQEVYREATEPIQRYPLGTSVFKVEETVNSGYPTMDGIVETVHISEYRNIQHFFAQSEDESVGATYARQWKEEFRQWSPWEKLLTSRDLKEHIEDKTVHLTEKDRKRMEGYVHDQIAPATTWTIQHNLDKYPAVSIVDSGGNVVVGDVQHASKDKAVLAFSVPFSGKAYLS